MRLFLLVLLWSVASSQPLTENRPSDVTFDDVHNVVKKAKDGVGYVRSLADTFAEASPKLSKLVEATANIAAFLGPIGTFFSLVSLFVAKGGSGESKELKTIKAGFKQVNIRFDKLDNKLNELTATVKQVAVYKTYDDIQRDLNTLSDRYEDFTNNTQEVRYREAFIHACKDTRTGPDVILNRFHDIITSPETSLSPGILGVMLEHSEYDFSKLQGFFQIVIKDAAKAAMLGQACLGMTDANNTNLLQNEAEDSQTRIQAMVSKFQEISKKLVDEAREKRLDHDAKSMLESWKGLGHAEFCRQMKQFLTTKYPWLLWNVYVFNPVKDQWTRSKGKEHVWASWEEHGRNLVITWSDPETYKSKKSWLFNMRGETESILQRSSTSMYRCSHVSCIEATVSKTAEVSDSFLIVDAGQGLFSNVADNTLEFYNNGYYISISVV